MKLKDLHNLLALGEGFTAEFKRSGTSNLGREICAFANATGGVILLGVGDTGEIVGVEDHNRLKSEVQAIARTAEPPVAVEIESVGEVLAVTVPAQHGKPYSFGGKFFIREGACSQQMSRAEIREFFYKEGLIHFDETPCERFSLADDLTDEVWERFRRRAKIPAELEALAALVNLHLVRDAKMTQAGAWLLARDITKFNTGAAVACALFMGTDKVRILDRRGFAEDIYSMIDQVMDWILSKINVEFIIRHVKREERPELPEEAIREAVVNAVVHRDYRSTAGVHVYLFKDRLEVVSPGGLPAGMTEADLGVKSIPRNPLLFAMLHRMEAVEQIGSGIRRIRHLCLEHGIAEPKIEASEHWFTVIFPRPQSPDDQENEIPGKHPASTPQVPRKYRTSTPQVRAMLFEAAAGDASRTQLQAAAGIRDREHFRQEYLKPLLDSGLLEMTIPDKPRSSKQRYRLTATGHAALEAWEQQR